MNYFENCLVVIFWRRKWVGDLSKWYFPCSLNLEIVGVLTFVLAGHVNILWYLSLQVMKVFFDICLCRSCKYSFCDNWRFETTVETKVPFQNRSFLVSDGNSGCVWDSAVWDGVWCIWVDWVLHLDRKIPTVCKIFTLL